MAQMASIELIDLVTPPPSPDHAEAENQAPHLPRALGKRKATEEPPHQPVVAYDAIVSDDDSDDDVVMMSSEPFQAAAASSSSAAAAPPTRNEDDDEDIEFVGRSGALGPSA